MKYGFRFFLQMCIMLLITQSAFSYQAQPDTSAAQHNKKKSQEQDERKARKTLRMNGKKIKDSISGLDKDAMVIAFDENGRMIQFPNQVIKRKQVVVFKVQISKSWFAGQVNNFFTKVDSVYDYFYNHRENQFVLWSIFGDVDTLVENWLADLETYRAFRQELGGDSLYNLSTYDSRIKRKSDKYKDSLKYFPVVPFINRLLFYQFRIRTFSRNLAINNEIRLKPEFSQVTPGKNDCYWWYSERILLDTLLGSHCNDCNNNIRFSLVTENPLQATVTEWYNKQFTDVRSTISTDTSKAEALLIRKLEYLLNESSSLAKLQPEHEDSVYAVIQWLAEQAKNLDSNGNLKVTAEGLNAFPGAISIKGGKDQFDFKRYFDTLCEVRHWLFQWLWYNKGFLVISPFALQVPPDDSIKNLQQRIKDSTRRLQNLHQQKDFFDSTRVHVNPQLQNFAEFNRIQAKTDSIRVLIDSTNEHIAALTKQLEEYSMAKEQAALAKKYIGITGQQVYAGHIPVYGHKEWYRARALFPGKLNILKQFTYSDTRKTIAPIYNSERAKSKSNEIPENEKALLAIHNIPIKSKVELTNVLTGYDDTEEFTILFQKLMKDLDSTGLLQVALAGPLSGFSNFILNTLGKKSEDVSTEDAAREAGKLISSLHPINPMTVDYLQQSAKNSPVNLTRNMIVLKNVIAKVDTTKGYISSYYPVPDSIAPYMVNGTLLIDSVKAKFNLRVGALRRTQLAAGFAIVRNPVQQNAIDTTGSGFKTTSSSSNNSSAILGVKIYPARTFLRDGSLWPRYPLRRLSLMIAVAVPKPLNNLYLGGGYDIVPGLTYTMGWNIYKQNYYQVQNAEVIKSATRYANGGVYYGVTLNPVVFVQFIKLFFN